jgi:hypothetical protein
MHNTPGKHLLGCALLLSILATIVGIFGMAFGYWYDEHYPGKPRTLEWDSIFLAFLPWLAGVVLIGTGIVVGLITLVLGVVELMLRHWKAKE